MMAQDRNFKFNLPSGWNDQTVYHFKGPDLDGKDHTVTMTIDRNPQVDNIGEFASMRTSPILNSLQGVEVMKNEETTIEYGNPSWEFVYKWVLSDDIKLIIKNVYVFKNGMGFSFDCEFSKKSYKLLGGQMKSLIDSLVPGTYEPIEED